MNAISIKKGIRKIAWGYLVFFLQFTVGTVQLIPHWLGFFLVYQGVKIIGEKEESALLLKPLILCLGGLSFIDWLLSMMSISIQIYLFDVITISLGLYLHFQLLTNVAHVMDEYGKKNTQLLRVLAIVKTGFMTAYFFLEHWSIDKNISIFIIAMSFLVEVRVILFLFSCSKNLKIEIEV